MTTFLKYNITVCRKIKRDKVSIFRTNKHGKNDSLPYPTIFPLYPLIRKNR